MDGRREREREREEGLISRMEAASSKARMREREKGEKCTL